MRKSELPRREFLKFSGSMLSMIWLTSSLGALGVARMFNEFDSKIAEKKGPQGNQDAGTAAIPGSESSSQNLSNGKFEPLRPVSLPNSTIQMIGVSHTIDTYYENLDEIEDIVNDSDVVVLEYFDPIIRGLSKPDINLAEETIESYNTYTGLFFAGVAQRCAHAGKDIVVVNPETSVSLLLTMIQMFGFTGGSALEMGSQLFDRARGKYNFSKEQFISAAAVLGLGIAGWTSFTNPDNSRDFAWDYIDWRDNCSAIALRDMDSLLPAGSRVKVFQGAYHDGMLGYLERPTLARVKDVAYTPYNLTSDRKYERYRFDSVADEWKLVERVKY